MSVEFNSVRILAREFGSVPMELRRELRPRMRQAGEAVRAEIRSEAAEFSSTIPAAVRLTVGFSKSAGGVKIWIDSKKAPHARVLEGLSSRGGSFRHPVFGTDKWVEQPARPFFFPVVRRHRDKVRSLVEDAVRASFPRGTST